MKTAVQIIAGNDRCNCNCNCFHVTIENMKKLYAIYCTVELIDQPDWLATFRSQYDEPYDFHITLKQLAHIKDADLPGITETLENILKDYAFSPQQLRLEFDQPQADAQDIDSGKGWIYVFASKRNPKLDRLQRQIREALSSYSDYNSRGSFEYEHNFQPHITIARELNAGDFARALKELPEHIRVTGEIPNVVLLSVNETTLAEAKDTRNLIKYPLQVH